MKAFCAKCGHTWLPRQEGLPRKCPRCQSQSAVRRDAFNPPAAAQESIYEHLLRLRGAFKNVYRELGGAEKFIRELRAGYER